MDIEELLTEARRYTKLALSNTTGDRAILAQIAQACAQTAQAMIFHGATTDGPSISVNDANA